MAVNDVTIRVGSTDNTAADFDALKLRLDEMARKVATATVDVNDKQAVAKVAAMNARLAEISKKVASPRIDLAGVARAEAQLAGLDAQLDEMSRKRVSPSVSGGGLSSLPAPGGGLLLGGAVAAAAGPALAELTGLATGLVAATAGVGSFAAFAIPAFKQVSAAVGDTPKQLAKLPKPIQDAVGGIRSLEGEFKSIAQAIQPQVFQVFDTGLQIAGKLLPVMGEFAMAAAPAIEKFMTALSKKIDSQGFKDLINHLVSLTPGAITAIGNGLLQVAGAAGKLLQVMSNKDVIHTINIAFDALKDTINIVSGVVTRLMTNWDQMSHAASVAWNDIYTVVARVVGRVITIMRSIVDAAATAFGWVPGIGPKLKDAQKSFDAFAGRVNDDLNGITGQAKAAADMVYSIGDAATTATAAMNRVPGVSGGRVVARAAGGIVGAAGGGARSSTVMVGEHGRELVSLPYGSTVHSNPDSERMIAGDGGGLQVVFSGIGAPQFRTLVKAMWPSLQLEVRNRGGGGSKSAQVALGQVS